MHPEFLVPQPVKLLGLLLPAASPFPLEELTLIELAENKDPFVNCFWEGSWGENCLNNVRSSNPNFVFCNLSGEYEIKTTLF